MEPLGDGLTKENGGGVGDVATHGIAIAVGTENIGCVTDGLDVDALSRQKRDVPLVGGDACDDVLGGECP